MSTKQEIIDGIRLLASEAKRVASHFEDEHWQRKTADGWTVKEVYCHLLSTARGMTMFLPAIQSMPDGADMDGMFNIDDVNAQGIASTSDKKPAEVVAAIGPALEALIPVIQGLDDAIMNKKLSFFTYRNYPVSELAMGTIVLHGLAHTYHCASATP